MRFINNFPQIVLTLVSLYILWILVESTEMIQILVNAIK